MVSTPWYRRAFSEHECDDMSYEFHLVGLTRRDSDGLLMWSTDEGCSCPSPWERHTEADWRLLQDTWEEFEAAVREGRCDGTAFLAEAKMLLAAPTPSAAP